MGGCDGVGVGRVWVLSCECGARACVIVVWVGACVVVWVWDDCECVVYVGQVCV